MREGGRDGDEEKRGREERERAPPPPPSGLPRVRPSVCSDQEDGLTGPSVWPFDTRCVDWLGRRRAQRRGFSAILPCPHTSSPLSRTRPDSGARRCSGDREKRTKEGPEVRRSWDHPQDHRSDRKVKKRRRRRRRTPGRHDAAQGRGDVKSHRRREPRHLAAAPARPANHLRPCPTGARRHVDTDCRGCGECETSLECIAHHREFVPAGTNSWTLFRRDAFVLARLIGVTIKRWSDMGNCASRQLSRMPRGMEER